MAPGVAEDTAFLTLEAEEDGELDTHEEITNPVRLGVGCREDMLHTISREIINRLQGRLIERIIRARTDIQYTEIGKSSQTQAAVLAFRTAFTVVIGVLGRRVFVSYLSMRHEVELEIQFIPFPLNRHIFTEAVIIHLLPYTDIALIEAGSGACEALGGIAPEGIIDFRTEQEIADTERSKDIMACIER